MANPLAPVTLTANTVSTKTIDSGFDRIEVLNATGSAEVYFTVDGSTPTVGGAGCFVLPATIAALEVIARDTHGEKSVTVKLISSGTPKVSVRGT